MAGARRLLLVGLVVALGTAGSVSAHGTHSVTLHRGSHEHPEGANTSLLCTKFRVPGDHRVVVEASGPSVDDPVKVIKRKGDAERRRRVKVKWTIRAPGDYEITAELMKGDEVLDRSTITYTVPNGPPAVGPFPCR